MSRHRADRRDRAGSRVWPALAAAILTAGLAAGVLAGCAAGSDPLLVEASGGDTTVHRADGDAFSTPAANLDTLERRRFERGDRLFTRTWVPAPGSEPDRDGLGPVFNAPSCSRCHVLDGRGVPPSLDAPDGVGFVLRISDPAGAGPHPVYGHQIQTHGIAGVPPEAQVGITHDDRTGRYPDGTTYVLRAPSYALTDPGYGDSGGVPLSPRVAPAIFGLGLLAAVPEDEILASADPDDADGDGISGRPNLVWSPDLQRDVLGRFGWKAAVGSLVDQVARAFRDDIGITSRLMADEACTPVQVSCRDAPSGGSPELSDADLADIAFYAATLGVPARRGLDAPDSRRGAELFLAIGCEACHTATFTTGSDEIGALAGQDIHPYTDLLLHDMGPGLADGRIEGLASGAEWRTPPLWGLGLIERVNGHTSLLHDGRARTIEEAILWHGGEADTARTAFTMLDAEDRRRVIAFLESL